MKTTKDCSGEHMQKQHAISGRGKGTVHHTTHEHAQKVHKASGRGKDTVHHETKAAGQGAPMAPMIRSGVQMKPLMANPMTNTPGSDVVNNKPAGDQSY